MMTHASEVPGFVASALVLATFAMRDMRLLRMTAIASNVAFIVYAGTNWVLPVLLLHLLLLPVNIRRLAEHSGMGGAATGAAGSRKRGRTLAGDCRVAGGCRAGRSAPTPKSARPAQAS